VARADHTIIEIQIKRLRGPSKAFMALSSARKARTARSGPPTGPGGRPPGLSVTHAQWVGGRPFRFSARAGRVGVVIKFMPGRAGGRSIFRPGARGRRPVFDLFCRETR